VLDGGHRHERFGHQGFVPGPVPEIVVDGGRDVFLTVDQRLTQAAEELHALGGRRRAFPKKGRALTVEHRAEAAHRVGVHGLVPPTQGCPPTGCIARWAGRY
jgi:hypothetical protein